MTGKWTRCGGAMVAACMLALAAGGAAQTKFEGVEYVGRWTGPEGARLASYGGSAVVLRFHGSSAVRLDVTAKRPAKEAGEKFYVRVIVDGGAPVRIGLEPGAHPGLVLAEKLSQGPHTVELRHDQEPSFGAMEVGRATLEPGGAWESFTDTRPIVEVIEDSDATGICVLGPTNPAKAENLGTSAWSSQLLSWPALLETELAARKQAAQVVDLALSGSTAASENETYDLAAPVWSEDKFSGYANGQKAALVLFWGGSNEKNMGGEMASGTPATYANLSPFQRGIYDQIMKVAARNPEAHLALLEYADRNVPRWMPAYLQMKALLPEAVQGRISFLSVKDDWQHFSACEAAPNGHPDRTTQERWTAQILDWIVAERLLPQGE